MSSLAHLRFELCPVAPFRLDLTAWALRRRPNNAVDRFDGTSYQRIVDLAGGPVAVTVSQIAPPDSPRLTVELLASAPRLPAHTRVEVTALLTRTLGLDADLAPFYRLADHDERLAELARRFRGLRPVRFPSIFEALVNAVACQQLSLTVGITVLSRMAARFGIEVPGHPGHRSFPSPERLAGLDPVVLRALGFSTAKARAVIGLARRIVGEELDLEAMAHLDKDEVVGRLVALPGIGRWSAEYVLLRGYGRLDVLPGDDVGARNNLARRFGLASDAGYAEVAMLAKAWSPYGGLVYFHLLLDGLERSGALALAVEPTRGRGDETRSSAPPSRQKARAGVPHDERSTDG